MYLENQILKQLREKQKELSLHLFENYSNEDSINRITDFFNLFDQTYQAIDKMCKMNAIAIEKHKSGNTSLDLIIDDYKIDSIANEDKAKKWLVNALILVVMNKNTYNGLYFTDGSKNTLKHEILKDG